MLHDLNILQLILFSLFVCFTKDGKFLKVIFLLYSVLFLKISKV